MTSTKDHILFTALKLILKNGYGNVTMNELVKASGMSKGAFYHYFTSKDQIYQNTMDKYFFSYMESFNLEYNTGVSFKENLFRILSMFIELAKEIEVLVGPENHMISYYQTIMDGAIRSEEMKRKISQYYSIYISSLAHWIEAAQENNEVRKDLDSMVLSKHLCSLMEGIMIVYSFQNQESDLEKYFNEIFYQFFELINNDTPHEKN